MKIYKLEKTAMNVSSLRSIVETYRQDLKNKGNAHVRFGEGGPVHMGTIDAIVAVLDGFEKRLMGLEKTINNFPKNQNGANHSRSASSPL